MFCAHAMHHLPAEKKKKTARVYDVHAQPNRDGCISEIIQVKYWPMYFQGNLNEGGQLLVCAR